MNTENTNLAQSITKDISAQDIKRTGNRAAHGADQTTAQRAAYLAHPVPDYAERIADLDRLAQFVREHKEAICDAINQDLVTARVMKPCCPKFCRRSMRFTTVKTFETVDETAPTARGRFKSFFGAKIG